MRWKTWHLVLAMLTGAVLMAAGHFVADCRARRAYWLDRTATAARSVEMENSRAARFDTNARETEALVVELLSAPDRGPLFHQRLDYLNQEINHQRKAANQLRDGIARGQRDEQEFSRRAVRPWSHPIPR